MKNKSPWGNGMPPIEKKKVSSLGNRIDSQFDPMGFPINQPKVAVVVKRKK